MTDAASAAVHIQIKAAMTLNQWCIWGTRIQSMVASSLAPLAGDRAPDVWHSLRVVLQMTRVVVHDLGHIDVRTADILWTTIGAGQKFTKEC